MYGDSGIVTNIKHHWPIPFLARSNPRLSKRMRGVTFFDFGHGWLRSTRNLPVSETTLISAGIGLRYPLTHYLQGFMDFAWWIGNYDNFAGQNFADPEIQPSTRIHFGIRSDLLSQPYTAPPAR